MWAMGNRMHTNAKKEIVASILLQPLLSFGVLFLLLADCFYHGRQQSGLCKSAHCAQGHSHAICRKQQCLQIH